MRKIRNAISFILIAVILLSSAAVVNAEETQIDWANVDFETFNYRELTDSQWRSLRDWLKTEADLHTVFYVTTTTGDGWIGSMWQSLVYSLFMLDPVPFIQALALEDDVTQEKTVLHIIYEADLFKEVFEHFVSRLALPDPATAGEQNVLTKIISHAKEKRNMNITNWPSVDWSTVDWHTIDMIEWLNWLDEADLKALFQMTQGSDGAFSEGLAGELGNRFKKNPAGLILALSAEKEEIQTRVISLIVYNGDYHRAEFEQLMSSLTLPDTATAGERNVLAKIITRANEKWNMNITNPHTGDSIGFAALLMAVSGLGIAVLVKRRKLLV